MNRKGFPDLGRIVMRVRARVHEILEAKDHTDLLSRAVMALIIALILVSVLSVILESVSPIYSSYRAVFDLSEATIVVIFTLEFALRLWSCVEDPRYAHPLYGRLRFAVSPLALIDLAAILPFYLPLMVAFDARFLRALRLVRFVRIIKMARYSDSVNLLLRVLKREKESLVFTFFLILLLMVVASCLMWQAENEAQPEKFGSIPDTMWWAIATITTVGYGDVVPITPTGKVLGAFIAILGVGMVAMPAGIIVSGFMEESHTGAAATSGASTLEKRVELLERLTRLREGKALTEEEFQLQKADLLRSGQVEEGEKGRS